jgi:4-hydroxy-tetrahydrodipicolinate synthase
MAELKGIIPPMTTAFDVDGEIDEGAVRSQFRWMAGQGVHGVAVGGSTGEGHALDRDDYRRLIEITTDVAGGRLPVIAGIIVDSTSEAVRRGRDVRDLGVAALQVTPVHYLFRPTDDAMVDHFRALAGETGQPIIIYNVVPWTYLSPDLLCRIMIEVPEVIGVKQSAGDMKLLADLLLQAAPDRRIFTAVDALLYPSFALGAHGAIAAILSAAPRTSVELWDAVQRGDQDTALALHRRLSAHRKDDVTQLHQTIVQFFQKDLIESEVFLPWSAQALRGEIFASCEVLDERADAEGAFFRFRATADVVARLNKRLGEGGE